MSDKFTLSPKETTRRLDEISARLKKTAGSGILIHAPELTPQEKQDRVMKLEVYLPGNNESSH